MEEFKAGDRIKRIRDPYYPSMPLGSIWTVRSITHDGNLRLIEPVITDCQWYRHNFELVERNEMYYIIIKIVNNDKYSPDSNDIAHALADAGIEGKVSVLQTSINSAVVWAKSIEPNLLPLVVKDIQL